MYVRTRPPHLAARRGKDIRITIQCMYPQLECVIDTHTNQPLMLLRRQIAGLLALKPEYTQLCFHEEILRADKDPCRLEDLGFTADETLEAKQVGNKRAELKLHSPFFSLSLFPLTSSPPRRPPSGRHQQLLYHRYRVRRRGHRSMRHA